MLAPRDADKAKWTEEAPEEEAASQAPHGFGETHATGCDVVDKVGTTRAVELDGITQGLDPDPDGGRQFADRRRTIPHRLELLVPGAPVGRGDERRDEQRSSTRWHVLELSGVDCIEDDGLRVGHVPQASAQHASTSSALGASHSGPTVNAMAAPFNTANVGEAATSPAHRSATLATVAKLKS